MEGQAVFRWASYQMAEVSLKALAEAGITADDLDAFIPHQANMRITDRAGEGPGPARARAGRPHHRRVRQQLRGHDPAGHGAHAQRRQAPHGGLALLIGFGAGLVYAAQVVSLP